MADVYTSQFTGEQIDEQIFYIKNQLPEDLNDIKKNMNVNSIISIEKTAVKDNIDTYTIKYTDGSVSTFDVTNGASAYDIAVKHGFEGTEEEWLKSIEKTDLSNLKNSEGEGSVAQKNGGVTNSSGSQTEASVAKGKSAAAFGARGIAKGDATFTAGYKSRAYQVGSASFGSSTAGDENKQNVFDEMLAIAGNDEANLYAYYEAHKTAYNELHPDNPLTLDLAGFKEAKYSFSFAACEDNKALARGSAVFGKANTAKETARGAFVAGANNVVTGEYQTVVGRYSEGDSNKPFIIGGGSSESTRKNIVAIDGQGNIGAKNIDDYIYTFETQRKVEQNISAANAEVSSNDGVLQIVSTSTDPQVFRRFPIPFDGNKYYRIKIKYKAEKAENLNPIMYFITKGKAETSENWHKVDFADNNFVEEKTTDADGWTTAIFFMANHENWKDNEIATIRFDITNGKDVGDVAYIEYFGLFGSARECAVYEPIDTKIDKKADKLELENEIAEIKDDLSDLDNLKNRVYTNNLQNGVGKGSITQKNGFDDWMNSQALAIGSATFGKQNIAKETAEGTVMVGENNIANGTFQFVAGQYSEEDYNKPFIIGGGSSESTRKNIVAIDGQGTIGAKNIDDYVYTFETTRKVEQNVFASYADISCEDGALKIVSTSLENCPEITDKNLKTDPQILHRFPIPFKGSVYQYVKIKYKAEKAENLNPRIYFITKGKAEVYENWVGTLFSNEKIVVEMTTDDDGWTTAILNMSNYEEWSNDFIATIRLDITNDKYVGDVAYIQYFGVFKSLAEAERYEPIDTKIDKKADKLELENEITEINVQIENIKTDVENKADIIVLTSETAKSFRINDSGNYLLKGLTMNGTAENPSIRILGKNLFDIHIDKETGNKTVNTYITKSIRVSTINNDVSVSSAIWRMSFTYLDGKVDYVMDNGAAANYFSKTIKATEENPIVSIGYRSTYILSGSYDVQIELGTIETEFEPYIPMQEVMLPYTFEEGDSLVLEDGIVKTFIGGVETDITDTSWGLSILNLKTNYPNTTILCDANCNITYKADTANAYYNLRQAILNLGGTI